MQSDAVDHQHEMQLGGGQGVSAVGDAQAVAALTLRAALDRVVAKVGGAEGHETNAGAGALTTDLERLVGKSPYASDNVGRAIGAGAVGGRQQASGDQKSIRGVLGMSLVSPRASLASRGP